MRTRPPTTLSTKVFPHPTSPPGYWKNDCKHGFGKETQDNGDTYCGHWHEGKKQGFGKADYKEKGIKYEGNWKNDMKEGQGKMDFSTGDNFKGEFSQDQFKIGSYTKHTGDIYHGSFRNGERHGYVNLDK